MIHTSKDLKVAKEKAELLSDLLYEANSRRDELLGEGGTLVSGGADEICQLIEEWHKSLCDEIGRAEAERDVAMREQQIESRADR